MIVSHARRFIFFHNPKCAGMSFRAALQPYHDDPFSFWGIYGAPYFRNSLDHSHLRLWEMQALFPRILECSATYESVIFVRNPYRRFVSALNEHIKKFQPQINLAAMDDAQRVALAEQFIERALQISRITTDWRFVHFSPQIWFVKFGDRQIPRHVIGMEEDGSFTRVAMQRLGLGALKVPWINPAPANLSAALGSEIVRKFVRGFYADDFAFLRADDRLAALSGEVGEVGVTRGAQMITIYHNPACSTSRKVLGMIRGAGKEVAVIEYLKAPPSRAELVEIIARMGVTPRALLRRRGTPYDALQLADPALSDAQLIDAMLAHPILIERPIVVAPGGVKVCRPAELVADLL